MPAMTAYVNSKGGRRHAFEDCPYLRPGYRRMAIDGAGLDCRHCRRRLAAQQEAERAKEAASHDV